MTGVTVRDRVVTGQGGGRGGGGGGSGSSGNGSGGGRGGPRLGRRPTYLGRKKLKQASCKPPMAIAQTTE